jgi:hypothetical protein
MVFVSHIYSGDASRKPVSYQGTCLRLHRAFASQVITKLAKRGLLEKLRGVRNEKEMLLNLPPEDWWCTITTRRSMRGNAIASTRQSVPEALVREPPLTASFLRSKATTTIGSGKNLSLPSSGRNPANTESCHSRDDTGETGCGLPDTEFSRSPPRDLQGRNA